MPPTRDSLVRSFVQKSKRKPPRDPGVLGDGRNGTYFVPGIGGYGRKKNVSNYFKRNPNKRPPDRFNDNERWHSSTPVQRAPYRRPRNSNRPTLN